jgi:hypothetical protein
MKKRIQNIVVSKYLIRFLETWFSPRILPGEMAQGSFFEEGELLIKSSPKSAVGAMTALLKVWRSPHLDIPVKESTFQHLFLQSMVFYVAGAVENGSKVNEAIERFLTLNKVNEIEYSYDAAVRYWNRYKPPYLQSAEVKNRKRTIVK